MDWLNEDLIKDIRKVFEPRYKRELTNDEVILIACSLAEGLEIILKTKCRGI